MTFAVLLAWQVFFIRPKQKEMAQRRAQLAYEQAYEDSLAALQDTTGAAAHDLEQDERDTTAEEGDVAEASSSRVEAPGDFVSPAGVPDKAIISVETEQMLVLLSSIGGEITSVRLKEFTTDNGDLVELVPPGNKGGFALSMLGDGSWKSYSNVPFNAQVGGTSAAEGAEIVLGDSRDNVVVGFSVTGTAGELIEKIYTFNRIGYEVGLVIRIAREGELRRSEAYSIAWECGMQTTERNTKGDYRQYASLARVGGEFYKESLGKFGKEQEKIHEGTAVWAGARTKYFLSALLPERERTATVAMLGNKSDNYVGYALRYSFRGDPRSIEDAYACYLGPLDMEILKGYGAGLERTIDLGWLRFFSVFILKLMVYLKRFIPNYGIIIIILSILTKVLFYRLTHKSFKSMKDMQRLQPRLKELQEKYKDDKQKLNTETMNLYKAAGVNPLGGCLPLLFQMPVFIALFNVLRNTIELRGAPFVLWINDLSSPDVLFSFGVKLPFLGSEFHLLPILMGGAMVLQSKLGGSPTGQTGPAAQTKMMSTMMPIVFTVIFYSMPSGLVLYWLVNNVFSIIQQYYIHKEVEAEDKASSEEAPDAGGGASKSPAKNKKSSRTSKGRSGKSKRRTYH
jgi:YidC/Oxa1 family membrane protein insertase